MESSTSRTRRKKRPQEARQEDETRCSIMETYSTRLVVAIDVNIASCSIGVRLKRKSVADMGSSKETMNDGSGTRRGLRIEQAASHGLIGR